MESPSRKSLGVLKLRVARLERRVLREQYSLSLLEIVGTEVGDLLRQLNYVEDAMADLDQASGELNARICKP